LNRERFLPASVRGPVLIFEFRRLASICAAVAMTVGSSPGIGIDSK
jgi:hypothetical protein